MTIRRWRVWTCALGTFACQKEPSKCDDQDAEALVAVQADRDGDGGISFASDDGSVTVPLTISATVPCLRGDATATLSTSLGTVGAAVPGTTASLVLVEATPEATYERVGYTALGLGVGRAAKVVARVGEWNGCTLIRAAAIGDDATVVVTEGTCTASAAK